MSETVVVALISGICVIASALITSAMSKNQFSLELDKKIAVIQTEIGNIKDDIVDLTTEVRKHNNFAVRIGIIEAEVNDLKGVHHG